MMASTRGQVIVLALPGLIKVTYGSFNMFERMLRDGQSGEERAHCPVNKSGFRGTFALAERWTVFPPNVPMVRACGQAAKP